MRLGTCNSQNNPDLPRRKVRKIASVAARHTSICGFQEIRENEDTVDTARGLGEDWGLFNTNTSVPIGVNENRWNVHDSGYEVLSPKGKGFTPERYVSWVVLSSKQLDLPEFAVSNGHLINKGPGNPSWEDMGRRLTDEDKARIEYWQQGWEVWHDLTWFLRYELGLSQFCVGDFNNIRTPKFHNQQIWLDDKGIDKIGFIPKRRGVNFRLQENIVVNTPSDHHLNAVRGRLY